MDSIQVVPGTGDRLLRFVGDVFEVRVTIPAPWTGASAFLRTNIGHARQLHREIIDSRSGTVPSVIESWRDLPMQLESPGVFVIRLALTETGFFRAKPYLRTDEQIWPKGDDIGITVHPNALRTANTIYCAFVRMFGASKSAESTRDTPGDETLKKLDLSGYTTIPPSGKFRDLIAQLPFIMGKLGCRILHLLPVGPTPTTFARFGRFGSPYACEDLTAIDPALVVFDQRTTGVEQFCELVNAVHARGGLLFLDIVINHTGWGSTLHENHPDWFMREGDGRFASPGAWGNTWADLVELNPENGLLWDEIAASLLVWCRRGVDGFRCDAGYKVPLRVWKYAIARVRLEFPDAVFLLEGLGGPLATTELLMTEGGMQWAYSELFQNYSGAQIASYLDYVILQGSRVGTYIHYSETHDNDRLAKRGRLWSLHRNQLCALTSSCGGFGFTCGVEWLANEKVEVHQSRGMRWGDPENIVEPLARLNQLLGEHPCFFDGAKLERLSASDASVYALRRTSAEGRDQLLILANSDSEKSATLQLSPVDSEFLSATCIDILTDNAYRLEGGENIFALAPGQVVCLASAPLAPRGQSYRMRRQQAAIAMSALAEKWSPDKLGHLDGQKLADWIAESPADFLNAISTGDPQNESWISHRSQAGNHFNNVLDWTTDDITRLFLVPSNHWILLRANEPFTLEASSEGETRRLASIPVVSGHIACWYFHARKSGHRDWQIVFKPAAEGSKRMPGSIRHLGATPDVREEMREFSVPENRLALLTNGRGGMARICVDLGRIRSKYDCFLGANLHPEFPVDRHVLVKRIRAWAHVNGFVTPLDANNLASFSEGPPARWKFIASGGDGHHVEVILTLQMIEGSNTTVARFERGATISGLTENPLLRLIVRADIEDRSFHSETHRSGGADYHFTSHTREAAGRVGFEFTPAEDRRLTVFASGGHYHPQVEWSEHIEHPVERSRGQVDNGDAFSPGWFDIYLQPESQWTVIATSEHPDEATPYLTALPESEQPLRCEPSESDETVFVRQLERAVVHFLARRGQGKTVIAGYPWFLDWGRDTLIAARGLLSAGFADDVQEVLVTFGRFVRDGTMPNIIHGADASNRDTSDAPLWYGIVCEELAALRGNSIYQVVVDEGGRTIAGVLREIALGYYQGTPNGIAVDAASGLVWSPSHFTWMDTNFPAGTPREGYPVEIQILWIRLLRHLDRIGVASPCVEESWIRLAARARESFESLFWSREKEYYADCLRASRGVPAREAAVDTALRSNVVFAVSLGEITGDRARNVVEAIRRKLLVPGALRSLAPGRVDLPLPVRTPDGRLLNDPERPYWGRYAGDEDTSRKPAYHNGTGWVWTMPGFCEAMAMASNFSAESVAAARAYLGSASVLMQNGCVGLLPEIVDGDFPHEARGCDAQAWSVTEVLRVWKLLESK